MRKHVKSLWFILFTAAERFVNEQYTYRASALAYTSLLALVPLLFVFFFLMSVFPVFSHSIILGENYIYKNFLPAAASSIISYLQNFMQQAAKLPSFSILFLFITTLLLVATIEETLNDIWHADYRKGLMKYVVIFGYWIVFLFIPLLIGIGIFIISFLLDLFNISTTTTILTLYVVPFIIDVLFLTLVYVFVPHKNVNWVDAFLGAGIAAFLFEIAKTMFAFYLIQFPSYSLIYGTFAALPIFLIWLYIFWVIILYGALISYAHYHH